MKYMLALLLLAVPLSAQDQVGIIRVDAPAVEIINDHPITNEIYVMTDSTMLARLNENLEALREQITASECNTCGGASTTAKLGLGVAVPLLLWIAISQHRSANKTENHVLNIPPRETKKTENHEGES